MPPTRKQNGQPDDRRVLVDREEYAALVSLRESAELRLVDDEKVQSRIHDLTTTCNAQARRLIECDLTAQHLERVVAIQRIFIDLLRADRPAVASLEDLSTFWRSWFLTTEGLVKRDPKQRAEVDRLEPDLFRSWRIWVRDAGHASRTFAVSGTTRARSGTTSCCSRRAAGTPAASGRTPSSGTTSARPAAAPCSDRRRSATPRLP